MPRPSPMGAGDPAAKWGWNPAMIQGKCVRIHTTSGRPKVVVNPQNLTELRTCRSQTTGLLWSRTFDETFFILRARTSCAIATYNSTRVAVIKIFLLQACFLYNAPCHFRPSSPGGLRPEHERRIIIGLGHSCCGREGGTRRRWGGPRPAGPLSLMGASRDG